MRASVALVLVTAMVHGVAAFLVLPSPSSSSSSGRTPPLLRSLNSRKQGPTRQLLTVRHFTVGGEAPDGPTALEVFNTATALGSLVVGVLVALEVAKDLPQGWVNERLVEAAPSTLGPMAGRGLFALQDIPKDTVIGEYPGVVCPKQSWLARKEGEAALLLASRYAWTLANGDVLDPTLPNGELPDRVVALGGLVSKPTLLGLVNEPPAGVDVNLLPTITDKSVAFVAERDIFAGEELWIDYGPMYNRQHYRRR